MTELVHLAGQSSDCLMPGAIWDGPKKRCIVPPEDDFLAVAERAELVAS